MNPHKSDYQDELPEKSSSKSLDSSQSSQEQENGGDVSTAEQVPDVGHLASLKKIQPTDLSMHSDAIDHWQDEPQNPKK